MHVPVVVSVGAHMRVKLAPHDARAPARERERRFMLRRVCAMLFVASLSLPFALRAPLAAQTQLPRPAGDVDPGLFAGLHWRNIGPFRGGRTIAVAGVSDGRTYYTGAVGGGVWKTGDAGRTWSPIMDSQPVASIGALAVAPSDAKTLYVGSGEADMRSDIQQGNGMYRSVDAGATWAHIGLDDSRQIGRIIVAPHDPQTVLVAVLGHAYGPSDVRGVYRSTDGGATWVRTLFHDRDTGAIDLASDAGMRVVYASLWQTRRPPWSVYPPSAGPGSGLYKSTDGGVSWMPLHGNGFPTEDVGKIGLAVAPTQPSRVYAIVDAKTGGLYRSDDAGATWRLLDGDPRLWQRGWYFCHVTVDPKNADTVYISDTSVYRSTDGGAHFTAIKGSPDGDDFHQLWIDPKDPSHMVLGSDQGTSVSVNAARTWSSWFNQPTGQFYHVATDAAFPYHLYGAQQDSGAAMIVSRSDHRGIEERDWRAITAGGESNTIAPDPRDTHIVYGGEVDREDLRSNQTQSVSPTAGRPGVWRSEWTQPLAFGPDHALYAAHQLVFRSRDGGKHWAAVSADLTRRHPETPPNLDAPAAADADIPEPRGVVFALAPSPRDPNVVWAGTDDGVVALTRDGARTWRTVTPPAVTAWSRIDTIEASPFDARVAYVAVDRHRLDDDRPYIFVTRDNGRTWRSAASGIPDGSFVHVVRADPVRRGLLYAGTESGVFVSLNDGADWQSLRLNMPVCSVRDISVRDGDLAIATHGRAFWILDDIEPLRELAADASSAARLFAPRDAVRTREGNDEAEATPPEVPLGENPPNGAYLDYLVPPQANGPVTLVLVDAHGRTVRRWSSADVPKTISPDAVDFPAYWIPAPQTLSATPGMHRFVWDFHALREDGPLAPPGRYAARLTLNARSFTEHFTLRRDPRVRASDADLAAQATLATAIDTVLTRVEAALAQAKTAREKPGADISTIDRIAGSPPNASPRNSVGAPTMEFTTLRAAREQLDELEQAVESADAAPTAEQRSAWTALRASTARSLSAWRSFSARRSP